MPAFFAGLVPFFAFIWSLDLLLFYRTLYAELFESKPSLLKTAPALGLLIFAIIIILLPIRSCINKCHEGDSANARETYDQKFLSFPTDYDRENPVTKNEGLVRIMQKKLEMATSDEEKKQLKMQMQGMQQASVADAFSSYSMQKSVMYSQMQAVAVPRYGMPMQMMPGYGGMGYGGAYGAYGMFSRMNP